MATWPIILAIHLLFKLMTTTTEYGKQNIFAKETPPRLMNDNEQNFLMEQEKHFRDL